ncbi:hypothetical protein SAMN04487948_11359 [Halogranum amylolyticum]|uniref:Uncharacterized protein n=1 Tax=Halogranum amylolyticum TaxID=660520 RepID=A0A1H8UYK7_9EURY|nr:hypothetical protein SAMN04487948_11359 [Halogranum amylolyticum]
MQEQATNCTLLNQVNGSPCLKTHPQEGTDTVNWYYPAWSPEDGSIGE